MNSSWRFTTYRSWDEVDDPAFLERWEQLTDASLNAHVFNHPVMVKAWTDTYRPLRDIVPLYVLGEAEGVKVFLPLVLWKRNWKNAFVRLIVPAGFSDYDYHDPLISCTGRHETGETFWESFENVFEAEHGGAFDKIVLNGFRTAGSTKGWERERVECPYSDLSGYAGFDDFFSNLKKKLRSDIRRRERRLSEIGELTYVSYDAGTVSDAVRSLPAMLDAHRKRRPKAYKAPGFHERIVTYGIPASIVHFSELRLDGKSISWRLGFLYKKRFYSYMPAFLEEYAEFSPNKVHLSRVIEECFSRGVTCFDHLRGDHRYKEEWPTEKAPLYFYERESGRVSSRCRLLIQERLNALKG